MILKHHKMKQEVMDSKKYRKIFLDKDDNFVFAEKPTQNKDSNILQKLENPETAKFEKSFQQKVEEININRKINMLTRLLEHPKLEESFDSKESDKIQEKLHDFYIHPLVYPGLDSLMADINFKTFENHEYKPIISVDQARKFIFIISTDYWQTILSRHCKTSEENPEEITSRLIEKIHDLIMSK